MLVATNLAGQVIEPAHMFGGAFGMITEGVCKTGAGFVCKDFGGTTSCVPCTLKELPIIRNFQEQLNRVVVAFNLGEQYRLDVDARVGPMTTRSAGAAFQTLKTAFPVASAAMSSALMNATLSPSNVRTMAALTTYSEELAAWLKGAADSKGVAAKVPEAKPKSIFKPGPRTAPDMPPPTSTAALVAVGVVSLLAAVGLVGTAAYYQRKKRPGPRGPRGKAGRKGQRGRRGYGG